jgi:hypothetical protein
MKLVTQAIAQGAEDVAYDAATDRMGAGGRPDGRRDTGDDASSRVPTDPTDDKKKEARKDEAGVLSYRKPGFR